ncbi:AraC-like DNA-binding protein [Dysgonomonas sp. PFB1-18]|uniref:helix-turn-helix domain-containing protein n=1 Tax=unclassified Dysgonomonas TaxID=2630389 RepID=UPI002476543E|nr:MULTISPECIES: helix-turn-helix transcriptional regulator [unclassified Dysgonomonas]MDH6307713.1 AraC-like DNA-binding protein [Dysgonomonas sp. PF1-14]MDH6337631.1 AraC-like DNA-binding protein [Dysgonomonas sp. PF1-16]MDH6378855.1 AraC-like DNA-binding protein [Dysgonomonas sp. PFB1-18]MDH6396490.1 AraC-like DNA-binding protein [Dysgonomonas sp. PF1-23]
MELLYPQEHLSCYNYEKGKRPTIEKFVFRKDQEWEIFPIDNKAIFMLKGSLRFSFGDIIDEVIPSGKMMMLPAGSRCCGKAEEDCDFIIIRLHNTKQLCDCFSLDVLLREEKDDFKPGLYYLDINEKVEQYLSFLDSCMTDGLKCTYYFELKAKEYYFLLRAYYTKRDLLGFFYPLLSNDISFSDLVLKNHYKARTVQELAELTHYSLSGFQKRFKKVFGMSAYHWMRDERSKSIYHQINSTEKSFKEISDEYGFSSPSHFNDFCKTNFGSTPGRIRRKKALKNQNL